ncbi:MAG: hydrogenase maturation nickel metallochaperone HypA [Chloroflexota bacterium]
MHELSVTENILEIALRHANNNGGKRIKNLYLVIGQLSTIVDESVQFYWDIISKETIAEGARLHFNRIPAEMLCLDCNQRYNPPAGQLACPSCGGAHVQVTAGDEFQLEAIDIET